MRRFVRCLAYTTTLPIGLSLIASSVGCSSGNSDPLPDDKIVQETRTSTGGAAAGGAAAATKGEGWGSLSGQFVLAGGKPTMPLIATGGKDAPTCNKDGVPDETLLVDEASKGIANIVVFARKVSRVHDDLREVPTGEAVFDQKNCLFLTHVMPVRVNQPVLIKNSDPIAHNTNVQPLGDAAGSANPVIAANGSVNHQFTKNQTVPVPVSCNIHPWMKAYIFPRGDSYVAVSGPDGKFAIPNLPAGEEIEFQVWHERPGFFAAKAEWSKGRFKLTIPKDTGTDLGAISVDPALLK